MAELERLAAAYEQAEAAFLAAIRNRAPRSAAATTASSAAAAARAFNTEAYRKLHAAEDRGPRRTVGRPRRRLRRPTPQRARQFTLQVNAPTDATTTASALLTAGPTLANSPQNTSAVKARG